MLTLSLQYGDIGLFILRIAIAVIFLYHGIPKLRKFKEMASAIGIPAAAVLLIGLLETLGSVGMILGIDMQLSALVLAIIMLGAIWMKKMKWGVPFFAHDKTGWEFDFILLFATIAILLTGGGNIGL